MKKFPFFICVDDGGFPFAQDDIFPSKDRITFAAYETIVKISKEFDLKIPVAFTMKYLDVSNISKLANPVSYAQKLIGFLKKNDRFIEIAYHGLTHNWDGKPGEFSKSIPWEVQKDHVLKSKKIFDDLGISFPKIFIPPYHLWNPNVTDKLLAGYGVKYLISSNVNRRSSNFLQCFPRGDIGLYSADTKISARQAEKIFKRTLPTDVFHMLFWYHRLRLEPFHSYITHIGNFSPKCYNFWYKLLCLVRESKKYFLPKNNNEHIRNLFWA